MISCTLITLGSWGIYYKIVSCKTIYTASSVTTVVNITTNHKHKIRWNHHSIFLSVYWLHNACLLLWCTEWSLNANPCMMSKLQHFSALNSVCEVIRFLSVATYRSCLPLLIVASQVFSKIFKFVLLHKWVNITLLGY
jgi:hypothetical protein